MKEQSSREFRVRVIENARQVDTSRFSCVCVALPIRACSAPGRIK